MSRRERYIHKYSEKGEDSEGNEDTKLELQESINGIKRRGIINVGVIERERERERERGGGRDARDSNTNKETQSLSEYPLIGARLILIHIGNDSVYWVIV